MGDFDNSQTNSAVHALGQKIYRTTGKKMAGDRSRLHGQTHVWMMMMMMMIVVMIPICSYGFES
jgi:hypothetical protein